MTQEVRRLRLRSKTFTLVEQLSVILIVAVLATVIAIKAKGRIDTAKGEQTVGNMAQIAEKCVQYYQSNGSWPATIEVLKPAYLPGGFGVNPFGQTYTIAVVSGTGAVTVLTRVPRGTVSPNMQKNISIRNIDASWDELSLFSASTVVDTQRGLYEKRYLYKQ